jgi:hypothetical protein
LLATNGRPLELGPASSDPSSASKRRARFAGAIVASIWLAIGAAASGQTYGGSAYDGSAATVALCRQYAAAQQGMPADLMFRDCMAERHCRPSAGATGYECEVPGPMTWHGGGY